MNKKRMLLSFSLVLLIFMQVFAACNKAEEDTTLSLEETESSGHIDATVPEGLEILTDESGENVTIVEKDDDGNDVIYNVYVPKGENNQEGQTSDKSEPETVTGQISDPDISTGSINVIIDAFNNNRFHIVSIIDNKDETDLMVYDNNIRIDMPFDENNRLSLGVINGNFYLINPDLKTYTALSKTMMKMYKIDLDELNIVDEFKDKFVKIFQTSGQPKISAVSVGGKALTSYTYKNREGNSVSFYLDGNKPVKIESYRSDGSVDFNMQIEDFNPNIRAEDVNVLSTYTKKDIIKFISDLM